MKNLKIILLIIVGAFIVAFLITKKSNKELPIVSDEENQLEEIVVENSETKNETEKEIVSEKKYTYENKEFKFAVNLPGLVAGQKSNPPSYISGIFTFGVGDQSNISEEKRIPNTMVVYIWNDETEFQKMMDVGIKTGSETINGTKFDVYSFSNETATSYHYVTKFNGIRYDVGVTDKNKIKNFFLLK